MILKSATIYTAPECPHSKKIKDFLKESGVSITEKCILTNPEVLTELKETTGNMAIPVTIIEEDVFIGFSRRIERRLKRKVGG